MQNFDFVNRANAEYIEQLHEQYQRDPRSVPENWQAFFSGFELGLARSASGVAALAAGALPTDPPLSMGVFDIVHSYRELGHFVANLDPLGLVKRDFHPLLQLHNFGMTEADLNRTVGPASFLGKTDGTLRDLIEKLRITYCGTLGVEFTGIDNKAQRDWLQERMEPILNRPVLTDAETRALMFQLIAAEEFELYLGRVFIGQKRFGAEGAEAIIPMLNTIIDAGAELGGEQFIMNMAHRCRLNTLVHVLNQTYESMLSVFFGTNLPTAEVGGDGDVKYHLGFANTRPTPSGKHVKVSLLPNPSHLEMINPIHQGIVRCKQDTFGDIGREKVVPIAIHGDAAFTGQGVVAETLNLSELLGFRTGGTIHIIINNQIGFTTPPHQERFTPYPTDMSKAIQAPVFHVNGDDPEACLWAARLAVGFRQQFKCDVMIDLWCYRRNGHNETDEPSFTQPVMYRVIEKHPSVRKLYEQRLLSEGRITQPELDQMKEEVISRLNQARELAREVRPRSKVPTFRGLWRGYGRTVTDWSAVTRVPREQLQKVMDVYNYPPEGFTPHPKLLKTILEKRQEMIQTGKGIDWGAAEMLAWGTLLSEGYGVRLTGQDVERGTFSHRHAVLNDYETGKKWYPLDKLATRPGDFMVINSMLSEFAVLGFEWGYASANPRILVMWEAQFGDFVNGAQCIIDQIISSAESKWHYANGLVVLLPHGHEGAGPEHSNAYIERFLSMSAEDNWQVSMLSTPAQYFHALRRQMHRKFRKPLILFQPKTLLRDPERASNIEEFTDGQFQLVIDDPQAPADRDAVKRVLLCAGKMYWMLKDAREKHGISDIALVRLEQFYPFPQKELAAIFSKYRRAEEICWVQEESRNRGAWTFLQPRLLTMIPDNAVLTYHGRDESASPAAGSMAQHQAEERELIAHALELKQPQSTTEVVAK
ncbi:MAG: 2-oxoglutarate dehydrogenase E1 component [Phycisphaerae bacterium]|nr:2-oxoglutarate dehydrogenase E1 component [Phycisphaerae bacterium]MDW8260968.1 2-oxoglutarate dehydrogenase E1 component [Phycisphaerales bacterium]